jgi:hypothetical protein
MNMSETPEKKKARLRYDNIFETAWTDEFQHIRLLTIETCHAYCILEMLILVIVWKNHEKMEISILHIYICQSFNNTDGDIGMKYN